MVACFSLASICSFASCEKSIKGFYIAYMQNAEKMMDEPNIALKQAYMSPQLIDKIAQETERTDADAVLMAQDVSQYGIKSLTVEPLNADWYLVKYRFSADSDEIVIPVKACECDGRFKILDISRNNVNVTDDNPTCGNHCDSINADSSRIFFEPEIAPSFPGGKSALQEFLKSNLQYPEEAKQNNEHGRVIVTFFVDKDGTVTNPRILRGRTSSLDAEALRIVSIMPKWTPGKMNGEPKKVAFTIPIIF